MGNLTDQLEMIRDVIEPSLQEVWEGCIPSNIRVYCGIDRSMLFVDVIAHSTPAVEDDRIFRMNLEDFVLVEVVDRPIPMPLYDHCDHWIWLTLSHAWHYSCTENW